jgi:nicotinate-nucleotide--dimethylbenzimidazole phosphoribosyltransferase
MQAGDAPWLVPEAVTAFAESARRAVYDVIELRRDVRHFRADAPIDDAVLRRILGAAHLAPSVGFSQPWAFVVIREATQRGRIRESFLRCREAESARYPAARREAYLAHKLEAIQEAALNLCVAVDLRPSPEAILGTTAQPEAVRASACLAVQNLWLAARAEGIGVGWVSIVEPAVLRRELALPPGVEPIAYLCVGHPAAFRERPMLEESGWRRRKPLEDVVHDGGVWRKAEGGSPEALPPAKASPRAIAPLSERAREAARAHQDRLTKPIGSLGRLEHIATWYSAVRGVFPTDVPRRASLALFAADHGVAAEGVSAYGSGVTAAMVGNVMAGGAAVNALAGEHRVDIALVDVGISGDLSALPLAPRVPLRSARVRNGTANLRTEDAMSHGDVERALAAGAETAASLVADGAEILALGEIGIGNTTAAAAITAYCLGLQTTRVVGVGTGIDEATRRRKCHAVEAALARRPSADLSAREVLASFGGLEIAAMVGAALEAARLRIPVVLDGFVTQAAALVARAFDPRVVDYLLASHVSSEPGSRACLEYLRLTPLLDLGMRLGEGTGAILGVGLLRAALAAQGQMATFATAGIVDRLTRADRA